MSLPVSLVFIFIGSFPFVLFLSLQLSLSLSMSSIRFYSYRCAHTYIHTHTCIDTYINLLYIMIYINSLNWSSMVFSYKNWFLTHSVRFMSLWSFLRGQSRSTTLGILFFFLLPCLDYKFWYSVLLVELYSLLFLDLSLFLIVHRSFSLVLTSLESVYNHFDDLNSLFVFNCERRPFCGIMNVTLFSFIPWSKELSLRPLFLSLWDSSLRFFFLHSDPNKDRSYIHLLYKRLFHVNCKLCSSFLSSYRVLYSFI